MEGRRFFQGEVQYHMARFISCNGILTRAGPRSPSQDIRLRITTNWNLCRSILIAIAAALGVFGSPASARQTTNTTPVKLTVRSGCSLQTRPLMFVTSNGLIDLDIDATSTMTVICSPNTTYEIDIDDGLHAQGNNKRRMATAAGSLLPYNVYLDSARKNVWGKGSTKVMTGNSGNGAPINVPIYGRVPSAIIIPNGAYKDTLVVTINF
jgi:spore coat protein U-like protein